MAIPGQRPPDHLPAPPPVLDAQARARFAMVVNDALGEDPLASRAAEALDAHVARVDELIRDATAVLQGDSDAGDRLRQVLTNTSSLLFPSPSGGRQRRGGILNRHAIGLLLGGCGWAAVDDAEAHAMLAGAISTLAPLADATALVDLSGGANFVRDRVVRFLTVTGWGEGPPPSADDGPGFPGPPAPKPIPKPVPGVEIELSEILPPWTPTCAFAAWARTRALEKENPAYQITSFHPPAVCHGAVKEDGSPQLLSIGGTNFGSGGSVLFPSATSATQRIGVAADSWSDTEITVAVPANAVPGEVRLHIPVDEIEVCGRKIAVTRRGNSLLLFEGGTPAVYSLTIDGKSAPTCVRPGAQVEIQWEVSPGYTVRYEVMVEVLDHSGAVYFPSKTIFAAPRGTATGSVGFTVPNPRLGVGQLRVSVVGRGFCGVTTRTEQFAITVPAALSVLGMEITQGIQRYPGLGPIAGDGVNKSPVLPLVPSVSGKDTIVRAYIECSDRDGFALDQFPGVSGRLRVGGVSLMPLGSPPQVTARRLHLRTDIAHSLNFRIPAALCKGTKTLRLDVWGNDGCAARHADHTMTWTWHDEPALPVRWLRIRTPKNQNTAAPSDTETRKLLVAAFDYIPSPPLDLAPAPIQVLDTEADYTTEGGKSDVLTQLTVIHIISMLVWQLPDAAKIWVGLFDEEWMGGVAREWAGSCVAGRSPDTIAHELGHCLGLRHIPVGCTNQFPKGPYQSLSFAESINWDVPVNPRTLQVIWPAEDLMSYGCAVWTSPGSWDRMRGRI